MSTALLNTLLYFPSRGLHATPAAMGLPFRDVAFPTDDGEQLFGWWIPARTQPARAHVLHCHGNAGSIADRVYEAELLAPLGLDLFLFDYRGYGLSSGRPSEQGTYRDARAARQALLEQEGVDPRRLVFIGESLGAAVALELALQHPPAGLVLRSPWTSIRDMGRLHYPFVPPALVPNAYPSRERIGGLRCPLLIVHGARDDIVPAAHGQALFEAAPEPKRLFLIPRASHNDLLVFDEYGRTMADWMEEVAR